MKNPRIFYSGICRPRSLNLWLSGTPPITLSSQFGGEATGN
jgi:hypothetical protein